MTHPDGDACIELYASDGGRASLTVGHEDYKQGGIRLDVSDGQRASLNLFEEMYTHPAISLTAEPGRRQLELYDGGALWGSILELSEDSSYLMLNSWDSKPVWHEGKL